MKFENLDPAGASLVQEPSGECVTVDVVHRDIKQKQGVRKDIRMTFSHHSTRDPKMNTDRITYIPICFHSLCLPEAPALAVTHFRFAFVAIAFVRETRFDLCNGACCQLLDAEPPVLRFFGIVFQQFLQLQAEKTWFSLWPQCGLGTQDFH